MPLDAAGCMEIVIAQSQAALTARCRCLKSRTASDYLLLTSFTSFSSLSPPFSYRYQFTFGNCCWPPAALAAFASMAQPLAGRRFLLPKPSESQPAAQCIYAELPPASSASADLVIPAPRRPKTGTKAIEEWEAQADKIRELYEVRDLPLETVMKTMQEEHGFHAS